MDKGKVPQAEEELINNTPLDRDYEINLLKFSDMSGLVLPDVARRVLKGVLLPHDWAISRNWHLAY